MSVGPYNYTSVIPFRDNVFEGHAIKYLGVPLITKKIGVKECKPLVDKVRSRFSNWKNKSLSYAGRLQLIASVLSSMQIFWTAVFLLPKQVIYDIERLLKGFLWCQGELTRGKAKVSWNSVCKPKEQVWPISDFIETRDMYDARLKNDCTISDAVKDGKWCWPKDWNNEFDSLQHLQVPVILNEKEDYAVWVNNLGHEKKFRTGDVWKDMCINDPKVAWYKMVWFPHAIPRHAFVSWNKRMFGEKKRESEELIKIVTESVRIKRMGLKVKDSSTVKEVERIWNVKMQRMIKESSAFDRLSETYSPSTTKSRPRGIDSKDRPRGRSRPHRLDTSNEDCPKDRERFRSVGESYDDSFSHSYRDGNRSRHMKRRRDNESPLSSVSKSDSCDGRYQKSRSKRHKYTDEDDLTRPWMCEEEDPFTPRIRNFESSRRTRMPNNVKTYDKTEDPEDHVKIFQAAAQVERWAMPTWCHMFNSTLIGAARVWFDELPPESIDNYKDLKAAFLAYFMQQKKYVKDPMEIHNIKQKDGETVEDFMELFKVETGHMKGAPKCMRISGFMHGVNNPELTKRLNEHVPKTMEEMMITTTAFIRGEAAAASKKKGHTLWQTQSKRQTSDKRSDFHGQSREGRGSNRFTPLTRTPKEILAAEAEKRSSNKFCDFHNDKGHSTDECMQLKKQIEELVRAGKLSHLIKEIKHGRDQSKTGKKETPAKDKPTAIYMIQSWQMMTRQKVTQSFERVKEITFPPLTATIGGTLSEKGRTELCSILKKNLDIFAWQPSDMTGVPRSVAEHRLNIREGYSPVRQKKRG
nr:reverse transcriptase domain-containing protein [Tanacetum cinerariifolium]